MYDPGEIRLQRLLRILGVLDLLALVAVVMPEAAMSRLHGQLGLGELPLTPVTLYLARTVSLLYAFQGATFWLLANDVRRYRPLIAWWGKVTLLGAGLFFAIDRAAGLPMWWSLVETLCLFSIGGSLVWAVRGVPQNDVPAWSIAAKRSWPVDDPAEVAS